MAVITSQSDQGPVPTMNAHHAFFMSRPNCIQIKVNSKNPVDVAWITHPLMRKFSEHAQRGTGNFPKENSGAVAERAEDDCWVLHVPPPSPHTENGGVQSLEAAPVTYVFTGPCHSAASCFCSPLTLLPGLPSAPTLTLGIHPHCKMHHSLPLQEGFAASQAHTHCSFSCIPAAFATSRHQNYLSLTPKS